MSRVLPFRHENAPSPEETGWLKLHISFAEEDINQVASLISANRDDSARGQQVLQRGREAAGHIATVTELNRENIVQPANQEPSMDNPAALARWAESQAASSIDARQELLDRDVS